MTVSEVASQTSIMFRIIIEQPVPGVLYSLQAKDGEPLDPKSRRKGEALTFDFPVRVAPGPKLSGDQVRREGPERRFVYIRIGQLAGDKSSPWSRRMKIDIHDIGSKLLAQAAEAGIAIELTVTGAGRMARRPVPRCNDVSAHSIRLRFSHHRIGLSRLSPGGQPLRNSRPEGLECELQSIAGKRRAPPSHASCL